MPKLPMTAEHGLWILFILILIASLGIDLGLKSHRHRTQAVSLKEAVRWVGIWVGLSLAFAGIIGWVLGRERMFEFLAGYLVEESLSVDNMFVFVLIFKYFAVPALYQPRILKYGILGAIVMRFALIFTGVALIRHFHWIMYLFGAFLIFTALRLLFESESSVRPDQNFLLRAFRRVFPMASELHGESFFVQQGGRWAATPLFATLLVVEASDLIFATDSIPAVLAISQHPFIVFSSNIFAILGLRALYFLISGVMELFHYLRYGLSIILIFIGAKMLVMDIFPIPTGWSLAVVALCLAASIGLSILRNQRMRSL